MGTAGTVVTVGVSDGAVDLPETLAQQLHEVIPTCWDLVDCGDRVHLQASANLLILERQRGQSIGTVGISINNFLQWDACELGHRAEILHQGLRSAHAYWARGVRGCPDMLRGVLQCRTPCLAWGPRGVRCRWPPPAF